MSPENENKPSKTSGAAIITAIATLITAVGGLIYALKSKDLTSDDNKIIPKIVVDQKSSKIEKIFHGKVGRLETTFNLTFDHNENTVEGTYYYNKRQDQLYQLSGIFTSDEVHLDEFTKGERSAKCILKKDETGCYFGKMFNNDGNIHQMHICN